MIGWRVPGRIEVLGKHTDYAGGQVLVAAVDRAVTVRGRNKADDSPTITVRTSFSPDAIELMPLRDPELPRGHWGRYVQTVLDRLTKNFGPLAPATLEIESDLPPASGMSSSSAVLTGITLTLTDLNALSERDEWSRNIVDRMDLAGYAASIENGKSFKELNGQPGVGTSGGSLDHTGMLATQNGMVSHVRFDPPTLLQSMALPEGFTFVVAVSGVLAEKTRAAKDAYNRGPAAIGNILHSWNSVSGSDSSSLHSAVREMTGVTDPCVPLSLDAPELQPLRKSACAGYERNRLEQFLEESEVLVPTAAGALANNDLKSFTQAVHRSQTLAEQLLGNQVPETIELARAARALGATAASAFGAGFGGSVWALLPERDAHFFADQWIREYTAKFPGTNPATVISGAGKPAERA